MCIFHHIKAVKENPLPVNSVTIKTFLFEWFALKYQFNSFRMIFALSAFRLGAYNAHATQIPTISNCLVPTNS